LCGRFDPELCRLFTAALQTGRSSDELLTALRAHSPAPSLGAVRAPTLLIQGMADSLFGLDQADATARALAAGGTPVAVRWIDGGHDGASSTATADDAAAQAWIDHYLRGATPTSGLAVPAFVYAEPIPRRSSAAPLRSLAAYPGLGAALSLTRVALPLKAAQPQTLLTPPGGQPASVTTIPGLGALGASIAPYQLAALRGQSAAFDTAPVPSRTGVVGAPRVRLRVTSTGEVVTLFVSLWQVNGASATLPRRLVAPVQVPVVPGRSTLIEVVLPAATYTLESGSTWRVLVTSTDSAYAGPREARADRVSLAATVLDLPVATGAALTTAADRDGEALGVAGALAGVLLMLTGLWWWRRRRRRRLADRPDLHGVPMVIEGLVKTYADGHRAVDDVSWRAEQGQVVGLLGPNGAGKTTTMRMALGLIRPDAGTVHVMGEPVSAGAPVLGRVGALVEGPGFLPHLTGRQNLQAYWAATGRAPGEACYAEVLEVAALGNAVERPVRSYSHGMRQRLGIAQAMLGMPDLLVLDEPTNGLDPPQIAAMRPILHAYAATGRTVVISSHLLAEVEMTCSHVVVMHAGRVVMTGPVAELLDSADTTVVTLAPGSDPERVATSLRGLDVVTAVEVDLDPAAPRIVVTATADRPHVVRAVGALGADIVGVTSRRHLEEVFLGVIAQAQGAEPAAPGAEGARSLSDRLRQVRAR
ncbi:MAG TPA: ATP-binding cassette domain-containing protein, partial [Candidatus Lustribacter sp.]|nr:ATP-binding cassette domain-containing protein [Candidatus Lustribacter sp.]